MSTIPGRIGCVCGMTIVVAISGCGGNPYATAPVKGRLTLEGEPVAGAEVLFSPVDDPSKTGRPAGQPGKASTGKVGEDGSFTLAHHDGQPGALVGPHKVSFTRPPTERPTIPASERELMAPADIEAAEARIAAMPVYPAIPPDLKITPAEVEVKPGENSFEFTLSR